MTEIPLVVTPVAQTVKLKLKHVEMGSVAVEKIVAAAAQIVEAANIVAMAVATTVKIVHLVHQIAEAVVNTAVMDLVITVKIVPLVHQIADLA